MLPESAPVVAVSPLADILTPDELAKALKVKVSTIYEWMRRKDTDGALPYFRVGRFLRFSRAEVSAWMLKRRKAGDALAHVGGRRRGDARNSLPRKTRRTKKVAA